MSKSDGGIGKGAKAARLQRNKMVHLFYLLFCLRVFVVEYIDKLYLVQSELKLLVFNLNHCALQMREQKRAAVLKEKRALSGPSSPPRVIVSVIAVVVKLEMATIVFFFLLLIFEYFRCSLGFRLV